MRPIHSLARAADSDLMFLSEYYVSLTSITSGCPSDVLARPGELSALQSLWSRFCRLRRVRYRLGGALYSSPSLFNSLVLVSIQQCVYRSSKCLFTRVDLHNVRVQLKLILLSVALFPRTKQQTHVQAGTFPAVFRLSTSWNVDGLSPKGTYRDGSGRQGRASIISLGRTEAAGSLKEGT